MNTIQDKFEVLRKINNHPKASQRKLAKELGYSLGKLNYCLKELRSKGLVNVLKLYPQTIKNKNDKENPDKFGFLYVLTKKGFIEKRQLTLHFMKKKMREYEELKREIK